MKSILLKVILAVIGVAISVNASAYDFEVDGIYYNIVSAGDRTCAVTYKEKSSIPTYSGVLTIPETVVYNTQTIKVTGINDYAFYYNDLKEINLPNTLTFIGYRAFDGCSKLEKITLPQSLESIGSYAFENCNNLTNIAIPKSVTKIGDNLGYAIFPKCTKLKSIIVDSENTIYDSRENCNAIIETATNKMIAGCTTTTIPESVTVIGKYCMSYRELPKVLKISKNITLIDSYAFEGSYGPIELIIEDSDNSIRTEGVFKFEGLKSVYIGRDIYYNGLGSIFPKNTEKQGIGVEQVTFGPQVTFVHSCLFKDCNSLKSVNVLGELNSISQYAFNNSSETGFEFIMPNPNSITRIETYAFAGTNLKDFKLSENLTELGSYAFYGCSGLSSELKISKSLTKIEERVFSGSSGVTKLIIPNTLLEIGVGAFYSMKDLAEVVIEYGDTPLNLSRDGNIFEGCSVKKVFLDREMEYNKSSACPFANNTSIEEVIIGNNLKKLKHSTTRTGFQGCESLKYLELGEQLESFGIYGSFRDCENITKIYSKNPVPPANAIFETKVYVNAEVKVPKGSLEAYQADSNWRNFWNISEMDFSDVDNVMDDAQAEVDVYNLQGVRVRKGVKHSEATQGLPQGIYIINGEKVLVK